ncbi:hypothetical protein BT67DRAFT_336312, partial [Trichocladium antarcticum]
DLDPDALDTDELASVASDTLHETRPNRWRGHPSTWKTWTETDRRVWTALENARTEDLSAHLYNAFALGRGFRPVVGPQPGGGEGDGLSAGEGAEGESGGWRSLRPWTAWPVRVGEVPDDGVLPVTRDVNEAFTLRREGRGLFAGGNLEGEISATILRRAKDRFARRGLQAEGEGDEVVQSIETDGDAGGEAGGVGVPCKTPKRKRTPDSPTFTPVVSADDDLSYALLRPVARGIMSQLDDTLTVLHNSRVAGLGNMSDSSDSDEDETDAEEAAKKPEPSRTPPRKTRGGGRAKKVHTPLEGETEHQMLVRLARAGKKRIPTASAATSGSDGENERSGRSRSRARIASSKTCPRASSQTSSSSGDSRISSEVRKKKDLTRWGLRNWRDVIGAAAIAGFSPDVIARAAQRCATLFREDMVLHTLHEQPASSDKVGVETVRYVPGGALPSSSEDDDDSADELLQRRTVSRQSSARPSAAPSPGPAAEAPGLRRSRSGTPGVFYLCSFPHCPRAIDGFPRRMNLVRHLKTIHGKDAADGEQDSADEMDGGVHVDGFLQPIKIRRGWRAEDKRARPARARKRARAGSQAL